MQYVTCVAFDLTKIFDLVDHPTSSNHMFQYVRFHHPSTIENCTNSNVGTKTVKFYPVFYYSQRSTGKCFSEILQESIMRPLLVLLDISFVLTRNRCIFYVAGKRQVQCITRQMDSKPREHLEAVMGQLTKKASVLYTETNYKKLFYDIFI